MFGKNTLSFIDLVRLSLRIFKTKPLRTLLTITGMAVGVGAVVFLVSLGYGLQYILIGKLVTTEDSLVTLSASYPSESKLGINNKKIEEIKALPNVKEISAVSEFPGEITVGNSTGLLPTVRIVESNIFRLSGTSPEIGSIISNDKDDVILSNQALKLVGITEPQNALGKTIHLKIRYPNPDKVTTGIADISFEKDFTVVGIIADEQQPPVAIVNKNMVQIPTDSFKEILVRSKDVDNVANLHDLLEKDGFMITARIDLVNQAKKITNVMTTVLAIFGITALAVSAIGMFNTMLIGFIERTYEVGCMKAIGATDATVRNLFLMESAVLGTLGGGGGLLIGITLGKLVNFGLNVLASKLGGKPLDLFMLPVWFSIFVLGISVLIGIISGFWPALRAARLSPREAFVKK